MKLDWKTCFKVGISAFVLYLAITYWQPFAVFLGAVLAAASPLLLGCAIGYLVNILMRVYERFYFPHTQSKLLRSSRRPVCLAAAMLTLLLVMVAVVLLVVPQLAECISMVFAALPGFIDDAIDVLDEFKFVSDDLIASLSAIDWQSRIGQLVKTLTSGVGNVMSVVISAATSIVGVVVTCAFGFIFSIYLLIDKERLGSQAQRVMRRYLPGGWYDKITHVLGVFNETMRSFIIGQCTDALILGVLCGLGMKLLGLPYAGMIGPLVAVTALIPVVGAFLGGGIGVFVIFLESPMQALVFLIFLIVLQQVEGNLIYPRVVGNSVGLPGIWVLAVVLISGAVFGVLGMIISVPLAAAVYKLVREDVKKGEAAQEVAAKE